jgi:hypothetical protein
LRPDKGSKLAEEKRLGKYMSGNKESEYVLVLPDYADIEALLSLKEQTIRLYISRFVDMGILREVGKDGPRGRKIYAIGFWSHYGEGGSKRNMFLKETPHMKDMLRKFTVRDEGGRLAEAIRKVSANKRGPGS